MSDQENFSLKDMIVELRKEVADLKSLMGEIVPDHKENTAFRKRALNAIVGFTFVCLAAVGAAVLKVTGVLKL